MSEETTQRLHEAETHLAAVREKCETRKDDLLQAISVEIPAHAEALAKKAVYEHVDVTKSLGADGIRDLRDYIGNLATQTAEDVAGASALVNWPKPKINSITTPYEVYAAISEYLTEKAAPKFVQAFEERGFHIKSTRPDWLTALGLFTEDTARPETTRLCKAIQDIAKADDAVRRAKEDHDRAAIDDLWGN